MASAKSPAQSSAAENASDPSGFWFREDITADAYSSWRLKGIYVEDKSEFQSLQIIDTAPFGKLLLMDGKSQSASFDEFVYHEALVHPSMLAHPSPRSVFIGGGGEGATCREVLRHSSVEKVVWVDIDEKAVSYCRQYMKEWNTGVFEDSRVHLHIADASVYLAETEEKFDVIIMDICDPIEAGPALVCYVQEFYRVCQKKLNPGGVIVTQAGPAGKLCYTECMTVIAKTMESCFDFIYPATVDIPSFGTNWGYVVAGLRDSAALNLPSRVVEDVDALVASRLSGITEKPLRFYDGVSHRGMFGTPKWLREAIKMEQRIMTKDNPVFMY